MRRRVTLEDAPSLAPQFAAQDLADCGVRQRVAELDMPRPLVARQMLAAIGDEIGFGQAMSLRTTTTLTASPVLASGIPTAPASSTPGWLMTTSSISLG